MKVMRHTNKKLSTDTYLVAVWSLDAEKELANLPPLRAILDHVHQDKFPKSIFGIGIGYVAEHHFDG